MRALLLCLLAFAAVAEDLFDNNNPKPGEAKPASEVPPPAPVATNTASLEIVRTYAKSKGLALREEGDGPVRILWIGGATHPDSAKMLANAKQTIDGLELWTGNQETFIAKGNPADQVLWFAIFKDKAQIQGFVDARSKGEDEKERALSKEVASFPGIRVFYTYADKLGPMARHFAAYATSCLAVDAFYRARDEKRRAPPWIREGLGAEVQRLTCQTILCTTVSYEKGAGEPGQDWSKDVAALLAKGGNQVISATQVMRTGLEAIDMVYYQQMWSLFVHVRGLCGKGKGKDSKLRRILDLTAAGGESWKAVDEVLDRKDPALTSRWHAWALAGGK